MKFELLTGKKLSYNVAESTVVFVIWFVLKDFNIITRISREKLIGRILKEKAVTSPAL